MFAIHVPRVKVHTPPILGERILYLLSNKLTRIACLYHIPRLRFVPSMYNSSVVNKDTLTQMRLRVDLFQFNTLD